MQSQLDLELILSWGNTTEDIPKVEVPVAKPYYNGFEWKADKWYKYKSCGCLWEFKYPDFPAKGFVRKFANGIYHQKEIGENKY